MHIHVNLYKEMIEFVKGTIRKVGRKKFGYLRSPELTMK